MIQTIEVNIADILLRLEGKIDKIDGKIDQVEERLESKREKFFLAIAIKVFILINNQKNPVG